MLGIHIQGVFWLGLIQLRPPYKATLFSSLQPCWAHQHPTAPYFFTVLSNAVIWCAMDSFLVCCGSLGKIIY